MFTGRSFSSLKRWVREADHSHSMPRFRKRGVIPPLPYIPSLRGASFSRLTTLHLPFDLIVKFYTFSCILKVIFFSNINGGKGIRVYSPAGANEPSTPHTPVFNSRLILAVIPGLPLPFISSEEGKALSIQNVNKGSKYLRLPS